MKPSDRRSFLAGLGRAGAFMAAGPWLRALSYAQGGRGPARAWLRRSPGRVNLDRRVLGSFLEHLGRAVYTRVLACETLTGPDLKAVNTFGDPRRVAPQRLDPPAAAVGMTFNMPPRSYTVAHLEIRA